VVYKRGQVLDYSMGGEFGVKVESPSVRHFHSSHFHPDPTVRRSSLSRMTYEGDIDIDHPFRLLVKDAISEARTTLREGRNIHWRKWGW
jgi:hypothetical protein